MKKLTEFECLLLKAQVANTNMICHLLKKIDKLENKNEKNIICRKFR